MDTDTSTLALPLISEKDYISISIPPSEVLKQEKAEDEKTIYDCKEERLSGLQGSGNSITHAQKHSMNIPSRGAEDSWSFTIGLGCFAIIIFILLSATFWWQTLFILSEDTGTSPDQLFTIIIWASVVVGSLFTLLARKVFINGRRTARNIEPSFVAETKIIPTDILLEHVTTNLYQPPQFKWNEIGDICTCEYFAYSLANPSQPVASEFSLRSILLQSLFGYLCCVTVVTALGSLYFGVLIQLLSGELDVIWTFFTWDIALIVQLSIMAQMADFSSEPRKHCLEAEEKAIKRENIELCIRAIFYGEENTPEDTKKAWEKFIKPIFDAIIL
ncbi:hypothetical protein GLAREA_12515 [Glarea lozoyensis ATCC 20868]|uniref:Uncharacterized protein n=1 Tax=Glarea lozoyensis (strain ATCC 20868 / MF5171) TaxID=1116229 RepID=S3D3Q8_GLAL2|nr:uncharacterized protein GLAREA_12515 [Glarea lozoyensis ATCC 20868]EPE31759.1 hypothetical protein GLAREA_12515 [Glarea lozoyensis ATCC 20868]